MSHNGETAGAVPGGAVGPARTERDFLGEVEVPSHALYGIGTCRALQNSTSGGALFTVQPLLVQAMADVKAAAAETNASLGLLSTEVAGALVAAADEMAAGELDAHLPLELVQGGGGTAANLNVNEVLANRASQLLGGQVGNGGVVDPHEHANLSQSTNDVYPTAMCLAAYRGTQQGLRALEQVSQELLTLAEEHDGLEHLGRSCLQDAVPIRVADLHRTHEVSVTRARADLARAAERLLAVPLGATIVGNGLGAPAGYAPLVIEQLRTRTGLPVFSPDNLSDGVASLEPFAALADAVARAGRVLARVAADLRLLASGPVGGIGEVILPPVQSGSSIMPGKVNPVIPELVMQVSYQLAGAAHTVSLAAASTDLEVTPMGPVAAAELLGALARLEAIAGLFARRCLDGLRWHRENVSRNLAGSFADAVHASTVIGYDAAARARYMQMTESHSDPESAASSEPWDRRRASASYTRADEGPH